MEVAKAARVVEKRLIGSPSTSSGQAFYVRPLGRTTPALYLRRIVLPGKTGGASEIRRSDMRRVELALLLLGLTLTAAGRTEGERSRCNQTAAACHLEKKVSTLELQMKHCLQLLSELGEFKTKAELDVAFLDRRVKEMRRLRPENLLMADRADSGSGSQSEENVTSLMRLIDEEKEAVRELSEQILALKNQKNLLKMELESEKKHRRSLTERLEKMDSRLSETGSWTSLVEDIRLRLDNLSQPTNDLTSRLSLLLEERNGLKSEMENGKTLLKNLEAHIRWLEKELNETNNLKDNVDDLRGEMNSMRSNITDETVNLIEKIIEIKLADATRSDDGKTTEEELKMLEYQLEDRRSNATSPVNVSKAQDWTGENRSESQLEPSWKKEMAEMRKSLDRTAQLLAEITADSEATKEYVSEVNSTYLDEISAVLSRLSELEKDGARSSEWWRQWKNDSQSEVDELRRKVEILDGRVEELGENVKFLRGAQTNASLQLSRLWDRQEDVSEARQSLGRLNEDLKELQLKTSREWSETKRELEDLNLLNLKILYDDQQNNISEMDLRLNRVEGSLPEWDVYYNRLRKIESALSKTGSAEDQARQDEKIDRLFVQVHKLNGRTEDLDRKLDGWDAKIVEAKNWVAKHVDREYKNLEKRVFRHREDVTRHFERSLDEKMREVRSEAEKTSNLHRESLACLLNQSDQCQGNRWFHSLTNASEEEDFCTVVPRWDPELVVAYQSRPLTPKTRRVERGEELVFRCSHVGRYVLSGPGRIVCLGGDWSARPPSCRKLADEEDVENVGNVEAFCQSSGTGRHPHPFDCQQYFNCTEKTFQIQSCPPDLRFDQKSGNCVRPQFSNCTDRPAVDYHPLPGTSDIPVGLTADGTLVVFPGQNLQLTCIRPANLGAVEWRIRTGNITKTRDSDAFGHGSRRLQLKGVDQSASGIYSCAESGDSNNDGGIRILVQAVFCPEMEVESPLTARNSSSRRLASKISFSCPESHALTGAEFVVCLADGVWSDQAPTCRLKGCLRPNTTDDPWIKLIPDLPFYRIDTKLTLSCGRNAPATDVPSVVRCLPDETWSILPFPSCG
ncbi:myosin-11-like [Centruroides vittatus]|uniref:myosin-11-like n=1 Tax=Centruroides vittatus TaxID=120091 RepID=UPI0035106FD7